MRKIFCFAAAALGATAASAFVAGNYAGNHCDSPLAYYMTKAYVFVADEDPWDPVAESAASSAVHSRNVARLAQTSADPAAMDLAKTPVIKIEETPAGSNRLPGKIVINEDEEVPPQVRELMKGLERFEQAQKLGVEESTLTGPIMPYCEDDQSVPAVMPPAVDAPSKLHWSVFGSWLGYFFKPAAGSYESSEPPLGHAPDCEEDPAYHHQYPGCPYSGPCEKSKSVPPENKLRSPFGIETKELAPQDKAKSDAEKVLKKGSEKKSKIDTTECRPSDLAFPLIGWKFF